MNIDEKYLSRCIELGKIGLGNTAPNPMVGCVIVHNERIIGEGFTSPYGGPHAEVNAINAVKKKELLKEATLYVSLEPCSHFGKTPPCADLIVEQQIKRVVIGLSDPHEKVAGKGIERLKAAGCEVVVGVLKVECREHHKRFLTFQEKKRPYIVLKWAQTSDGFIAPSPSERQENPEPFWITNPYSRQLVHQWRSEEQAILVGTKTVLLDNPKLNVRDWKGKHPIRIVIDRHLSIPENYDVFDNSVKTIFVHDKNKETTNSENISFEQLDFSADVPKQICNLLYRHNITSVLIEGGSYTLQSFIDADLWDEARIFTGHMAFTKGTKAPTVSGSLLEEKKIFTDTLKLLRND
ncbi:bifunctional diaminohydroxyphosphoribosylaminopyrimidine deaminase/5-amino-6-(5-phosphoribosylamino)uracil reductase RibD [uncultured Croceitalea sp.]|uniref:bifunctional diaminohydroxyphosphoribosylaminopyrimidine deaminase/5-amino-6-(5-phosphoribosylamino)uracil reductase RibD n=1 Tax=uncultured Croceitalea sp. TaxID=1798908 RepID=UPI0033062042